MTGIRIGLAAAGLFAVLMWPAVISAVPETDLGWMLPMMRQHLEGRSLPEVLKFLFSPAPLRLGQPLLKLFLFPAAAWGWPIGALVAMAAALHGLNALMVAGVGRRLGFSAWTSGSASVVYLCLFAHFHSVLWPPASQHLLAVTSILGILWLYLKTEERPGSGQPSRGLFRMTLAAAAVSSLGRSAVLAPLLVLTHLLLISPDCKERLRRFDRWLPLFALFLIYPAISFSFVGDPIFNDKIAHLPGPDVIKMASLIGLGITALALLRAMLKRPPPAAWRWWLWAGVAAAWAALVLRDHRQLLLPYNGLVPWTALWASFLDPFRSALGTDSTLPYHYLTAQISLLSLTLSVAGAVLFLKVFAAKEKGLRLLPVWYAVCLIYILNYYSSYPVRIPSRYFIYLSPVFAWVFCAAGWWLLDRAGERAGWSVSGRKWIWVLGLAALCLANLLAVRLELFRGRFANSYSAYTDLRPALGVGEESGHYAAAGFRKLELQDPQGALEEFGKGVERRPFLLRYLLGDCRLSDARWITGGTGLRQWLQEVAIKYRSEGSEGIEEWERLRAAADRELLDYAVCIYGLAQSEDRLNRPGPARIWISQLRFLEPDAVRLKAWLESDARVRGWELRSRRLECLEDPNVFGDPLPWQKDDYGFGRFMVRLISGVDIRSQDDRMSVVP